MDGEQNGEDISAFELDDMGRQRSASRNSRITRQDNEILSRLGKRPVLKRKFGYMSILGFGSILLGGWTQGYFVFGVGYANGGPAGLVYGYILVWAGNLATFATLAELASMAPTAAGQYHWISMLAPRSSMKFLSYATGWLTVLGWQCDVASTAYVTGGLFQCFIQLVVPSYEPNLWHEALMFYGFIIFALAVTILVGSELSKLEGALLVLYTVGCFAVLVPMVYLAPHGSADSVFKTFINEGGWSSQGLSFLVGISGLAFANLGADGIYHMGEEIQNAAITIPRMIISSIFINGVVALSSLIGILFCIGNADDILDSRFYFPLFEVFLQATRSVSGSAIMSMIIVILQFATEISTIASGSRMLWSFSRDRGLPGSRFLSKVNRKSSVPEHAVYATATFSIVVGVISFGSSVAFQDLLSMAVSALYSSYFVACFALLWRRCQGRIQDRSKLLPGAPYNLPGSEGHLVWGPWKMPAALGIVINIWACAYLLTITVLTFFPTVTPISASTMNYDILVFGFVVVTCPIYYVFRGRTTYTGPVVEAGNRLSKNDGK